MRGTAEPFAISAEIAERATLAETPEATAVREFVMTRAAARAWSAINQQLAGERGALFWISGPSGAGKTHFLNYLMALCARAGALGAPSGRRLTIAHSPGGGDRGGIGPRGRASDREKPARRRRGRAHLRGAEGLRVVLDQAKRQGVEAVTVAIDFDQLEPAAAAPALAALAGLAGLLPGRG
jgi:hypothetical protein